MFGGGAGVIRVLRTEESVATKLCWMEGKRWAGEGGEDMLLLVQRFLGRWI